DKALASGSPGLLDGGSSEPFVFGCGSPAKTPQVTAPSETVTTRQKQRKDRPNRIALTEATRRHTFTRVVLHRLRRQNDVCQSRSRSIVGGGVFGVNSEVNAREFAGMKVPSCCGSRSRTRSRGSVCAAGAGSHFGTFFPRDSASSINFSRAVSIAFSP